MRGHKGADRPNRTLLVGRCPSEHTRWLWAGNVRRDAACSHVCRIDFRNSSAEILNRANAADGLDPHTESRDYPDVAGGTATKNRSFLGLPDTRAARGLPPQPAPEHDIIVSRIHSAMMWYGR